MVEHLEFAKMTDAEVEGVLKRIHSGLTVEEARKIEAVLGRAPTVTEAVVWGIISSEHVSYKSSKRVLKRLPILAPNVIVGSGGDEGIVEIAREGKVRWGLALSHKSHNHPLPILPFENAVAGLAKGVCDVLCVGAKTVAGASVLRSGDPTRDECRRMAEESIRGVAQGGASLGIPMVGGDLQFAESLGASGLLNILCSGIVREDRIIHSGIPVEGEGYDLILVGKPTGFSGMGSAVFASAERNETESVRSAVLEPDPLLMRHLLAATESLLGILLKAKKLGKVAVKDLGAGGIMGALLGMLGKGNCGAEVNLDWVPVSAGNLHASVIACGETQERLLWAVPKTLTQTVLGHYNQTWELGSVAAGAQAVVIGKIVKGGSAILRYRGEDVFDVKVSDVMAVPEADWPIKLKKPKVDEPSPYEIESKIVSGSPAFHSDPEQGRRDGMNKLFVQLLGSIHLASRRPVTDRFDKNVQGNTVVEAGEADAGMVAPFLGDASVDPSIRSLGVALGLVAYSRYSKISSYWQAADAVVGALRKVAAVGAMPIAITDCLNFGNPEKPETMANFVEAVLGVAEACKGIRLGGDQTLPIPVMGGGVSFHNAGDSMVSIGGVGTIADYSKAITLSLKEAGNRLFLLGERENELGGGAFYRHLGLLGAKVPKADFEEVGRQIATVVEAVDQGFLRSAHEISEGGMLTALAEMAMPSGKSGGGNLGIKVDIGESGPRSLLPYQKAFSETGGFVVEVRPADEPMFLRLCGKHRVDPILLGEVTQDPTFQVSHGGDTFVVQFLDELKKAWGGGLAKALF